MFVGFIGINSQPVQAQSDDGDYVYATSGGSSDIRKLDATDGSEIWTFSGHSDNVYAAAVSPDGESVYSSSRDYTIRKLDTSDGSQIWSYGDVSDSALTLSADDDAVYAGFNDQTVRKIDAETGTEEWVFTGHGNSVRDVVVDGDYVYSVSSDGNVFQIDATDGSEIWNHQPNGEGVYSVVTSPDGEHIYVGTNGDTVYKLNSNDGSQIWSKIVHTSSVFDLDISNDGNYVYSASFDGTAAKLDAADGSEIWKVDPGVSSLRSLAIDDERVFVSGDNTVALDPSDGSEIWLYTGQDAAIFGLATQPGAASNLLSGTVVDDEGAPVSNATVEIYGVDHSQITATAGQSLEERAQELLAEAKDPFPATWQPDLSLLGFFDSAEEDYVAVHSANVLPDNRFFDWGENTGAADLDTPQLTVAADEPLVMTVWDPTAGDTLENAVDEDLPGKTTDGTVIIKKLSMSGEVLDTKEIETQDVYKTGVAPFSKTHEGVRLSLGQGFYEVSPEGSSNSYVIASVGDMSIEEMGNTYATNLEDDANRLTDRANEIDEKLTSGEFGRIVVETDANGEFTADVPSAFSTVDVTAYKAGDFLSSVDLDQRSISELQKELEAAEYGGSIYVPTQTQTVSTPFPSTVNVEVKEVLSLPNTGGVDTTGAEDAVNKTINTTVTAAEDLLDPDTWDNAADDTKEEIYNSLLRTVLGNDDLEACIIEGAEEAGLSSTYSWDSVDDETAEQQLEIMTTCIGTTTPVDTPEPDDIEGGAEEVLNGAGDVIDYVLNLRIPFAGSLNPDTASVIVRYADGSFETMGDDYWSVDEGILGTDAVVIEDYPLPSDQAMASVEILASDEDGVDKGSVEVRNPAFNGETPALQAIKLNTLAPGAGQSVQLDVSPTDDSSFKSVKSAKVWDGDGNELSSTLNNGELTFTAAGEGSHLVKLTVDDTDGNEYVERLRIGAQEDDLPYDPSIRVKKGFLGTYAVVGDGAIDGEISQRNDATTVGVTLADGENPSAVRVHLNELDETDNIKVRLMQGSSQQSYDKFTTVFVYTSQLSEDSLVYRDGNQPISVDKGKYGVRMDKTDAELIVTYTDTDGTVDLGVNNDPSFVDRILFSVREQLGGISDGLSLGVILIPPVVLARRNGDSL
ncbi:WD40 repeat domain-containing protein [Halorubrum xinjiangense]|uniref:WD40 repeat domain-containing protein n=1 Tax=Halorubrum xinjiangense TaxID=261291 RepID=UPI003C6FA028